LFNAVASYPRSETHNLSPFLQDSSSNLFHNTADKSNTFLDASSTALLASSVYRLAVLTKDGSHASSAESARKALSSTNSSSSSSNSNNTNSTSSNLKHITPQGWLTPVVNPMVYTDQGSQSPEGQAFVVEMQAAWKDWVAAGSPSSGEVGTRITNVALVVALGAVVVGGVTFLF
jgi:hypothetical protein